MLTKLVDNQGLKLNKMKMKCENKHFPCNLH